MKLKQISEMQCSCSEVNSSLKVLLGELNENSAKFSQTDISLCTQRKLELTSWGLPERLLKFYHRKGITHMFKWQLECLTLGRVLDAGNLVYSAPTSAGKTLVAEILISKAIFELQKKALIILPFVSVVREKMFYFQDMYASSGIHVEGYMGGHSPSISFKQVNLAVCTIEKANSIINKLLEEHTLQNLGLVVVDELHLLGDPYRGYLLELLLTKLKYISLKCNFKIQIVGMSATLPNLKSLADWLNADLYFTDFRPVPLNEKLKCGNTLYDKKLCKLSDLIVSAAETSDDSENVGQLCIETIANGHSVLIFCPTKVWCENLAEKISLLFRKLGSSKSAETENTSGWILRKELDFKKINEVIEHLKMSPVGLDKDLHKTVAFGVAFHHAGLTLDERDIIEGSFRKGSIRVLCATSTLSSGVNLPARRVIIRSPMSFGGLMDTLTYRQMIGRAGRMGVDSEGESILICKPNEKSLCQTLMCSNLKPIESCLGHGRLSASLKRALLEIVASGVASTPEEVSKYTACTFLACTSKNDLEDPIQSCMEFLVDNEFIQLEENGNVYVPTPLAKACLTSSLPPDEGLALFKELQRARRCFVLDTDLHIIYQVTPYSVSEHWNKVDWLRVLNILEGLPASMKRVGEMVGVEESFLVRIVKGTLNPNASENRNKLSIHRRFYTSLALQDLVNEIPLTEVAEKYECNKGMLQSLQQSAATYAGMVTEFTKCLGWSSVELIFSQFRERLQFGIQRELCELMRLPLLNAMRARALFNAGFTSLSAIANASVIDLENVFFQMVPFQSKKEIGGETTFDREQRNKLEAVWITGKADMSIREAAELLIIESQKILKVELGLEDVTWVKKNLETNELNKTENNRSSSTNLQPDDGALLKFKSSFDTSKAIESGLVTEEKVLEIESSCKKTLDTIKFDKVFDNNISNKYVENLKGCPTLLMQNLEIKVSENQDTQNAKLKLSNASRKQKLSQNLINRTEANNSCNFKINQDYFNSEISYKDTEAVHEPSPESEKKEIDFFGSSFNFDQITECDPEHVLKDTCKSINLIDRNKDIDFFVSDSDSNSSVEILYESSVQIGSKCLSFSRLSDDIFDVSRKRNEKIKNMSTPISSHEVKHLAEREINRSRLTETRSPDLFSQSLTFDNQMGKILDFEDRSAEEISIINASASIHSDDLGFVSDLSPPKLKKLDVNEAEDNERKISEKLKSPGGNLSLSENGIQTSFDCKKENTNTDTAKRKLSAVDSPDLILDSNKMENLHPSKRVKYDIVEGKEMFLSLPVEGNDSDDEIMPTPKLDKMHLSNISKISRVCSSSKISPCSLKRSAQSSLKNLKKQIKPSNEESRETSSDLIIEGKKSKTNCKLDKLKCDKINIIDVCCGDKDFEIFCKRVQEQNILGLALGCTRKLEKQKNVIGMKILKKRQTENVQEKSLKCYFNDIVLDGIAFYWESNNVFYMSLDDGEIPLENKMKLMKILMKKKIIFRIYDAKEQIKMLHRCCSLLLSSSYQDPKVAFWLLADSWKDRNFSAMAREYLPCCENLISSVGTTFGYSSPGLLVKSSVSPRIRACFEAYLTYHMINQQLVLLLGKGLKKAFEMTEMPVIQVLAEMELQGFRICRNKLLNIMNKLDKVRSALEEKAYSIAGQKFTFSSSAAVSKVLTKVLSLEHDNFVLTKKKKLLSTSKQALQEIAEETKHPLPELILNWRKIRSISTKFVSSLLQITSDSTRVFGVSQMFTVTGRISMHEPNLQNIPKNFSINLEENESVFISLREVFVPSENCLLMSVDYSQIELRMLAHLSQDTSLINNIEESTDIFVNIAANVFGVCHYEVDETLRQKAKQICYGIIYGIGARNLGQQLQINEPDAAELINNFKIKYQGVKIYLDETVKNCRKNGYVTTLLNRRRYIPAINNKNQAIRLEAERQAVNTTIQGSAADLVKTAMVLLNNNLKKVLSENMTARLVLHLHDELIFEVGENDVETVALVIKDAMENAMNLTVSIPVKVRVGSSWGQLENFEI